MSESLNVIENMNLNIFAEDSSLAVVEERQLHNFAHGALIETLDDVLSEVDVDGDVILDSLTIDLNVNASGEVFRQIAELLRNELKSKLAPAVFRAQSAPVTDMLANVYRQHLPVDQSSNVERRFDALAESWYQDHPGQKFNPQAFAESVIKMMQAENPQMDIQQIAYVVYQWLLHAKNANSHRKPQPVPNTHEVQHSELESGKTSHEVSDSGLVLLSPYLSALFDRTGCLEKGVIVSDDAKRKALAVLKYAAFGMYSEPPRNAAVMNLLCGLPLTPVFLVNELPEVSDDEKRLVDSLLKAVIANWKAVGQMSPDGLRGSYFVRNGSVETADATDVLTVEKKAYDILLDKLPWSFTVVKHPWMKKALNVKWR